MSSSFSSLSPRDIYAQHLLSPSTAAQHVLSPSAADGHSLHSPSPSGQLTPTSLAHSLGWETGSAGGQERLWETGSAGGHSDRAESRRLLPGLSSAMVLLGRRLDQERRERSESVIALQRDFQAQQRTLGEITELLASGSLEATLRGLRQDVSRQQENSDLQAAALREGLLELGKQKGECARHRGELDELRARLSELAQPDTAATAATDWTALREAAEGTAEEVNRLWTCFEEQFRDIDTVSSLRCGPCFGFCACSLTSPSTWACFRTRCARSWTASSCAEASLRRRPRLVGRKALTPAK
mmetsp:Transcript_83647/g.245264  ORF Transcript_83647/g.245264 Transcript_83647/m.245264 type:complete len:300 (+) Transcript_83647:69-968(+)